jgi:hypothetical protein
MIPSGRIHRSPLPLNVAAAHRHCLVDRLRPSSVAARCRCDLHWHRCRTSCQLLPLAATRCHCDLHRHCRRCRRIGLPLHPNWQRKIRRSLRCVDARETGWMMRRPMRPAKVWDRPIMLLLRSSTRKTRCSSYSKNDASIWGDCRPQ